METVAFLRPFHGAMWATQHLETFSEKPASARIVNIPSKRHALSRPLGVARKGSFLPHLKASESASTVTSDDAEVSSDEVLKESSDKQSIPASTFPSGFEDLVTLVCEETDIAEVKLKVGDFEMYLKRDVGASTTSPVSEPHMVSPATAPAIPTEPMNVSAPASGDVALAKSSSAEPNPFSSAKDLKLALLEGSESDDCSLISSPTVGTFRRGRVIKGNMKPPICKEGFVIREGQVIGFVQQFSNFIPVRSNVDGEVVKFLHGDGEPVGYGDPLVAILPSFHDRE